MAREKPKRKVHDRSWSAVELNDLIEQATVDAHDPSEHVTGFYSMIDDHLAIPFATQVLGVPVTVEEIELSDDERIVAVCARGKIRQRISLADLPLPTPLPAGAEWILAYRRWVMGCSGGGSEE